MTLNEPYSGRLAKRSPLELRLRHLDKPVYVIGMFWISRKIIKSSYVLQMGIDEQIHEAQIIDNRMFQPRRPSSVCRCFSAVWICSSIPIWSMHIYFRNRTNTNQRSHHSCMHAMSMHLGMAKGSSKEPGNNVGQPEIHKIWPGTPPWTAGPLGLIAHAVQGCAAIIISIK